MVRKYYTFSLPEEPVEKLREKAHSERRSLSGQVLIAIERVIAKDEDSTTE